MKGFWTFLSGMFAGWVTFALAITWFQEWCSRRRMKQLGEKPAARSPVSDLDEILHTPGWYKPKPKKKEPMEDA